jgi:hypothetical protein
MLHDHVWLQFAHKGESLCFECVCDRADLCGVELSLASLRPCPFNVPGYFKVFFDPEVPVSKKIWRRWQFQLCWHFKLRFVEQARIDKRQRLGSVKEKHWDWVAARTKYIPAEMLLSLVAVWGRAGAQALIKRMWRVKREPGPISDAEFEAIIAAR